MGVFDSIRKAMRVTPIEDFQIAAAAASDANNKFSPGVPINPADGYSRTPRAHDFLTGYNIAARPRRNERVAFQTLQGVIEAYDIAQMAITHRIDSIRSLDWFIEPMEGYDTDAEATIAFAKKVLNKPDHELPFRAWLSKFLWDVLAYDAGTLYRMRNNAGQAIGLKVVDGTTIAPLIDYHGGRPTGDAAAYVQFAQGVPWNWLLDSDIIYVPFRPMPNSPYGKAPLESILLNANTDLRFQNYFLSRFTQGTVPEGFATAPESWGPDQIADFQDAFDAMMYGDESKKHQIRWVPGGTNFTWSQENTFNSEFSLFLMRKTAAAFHVTPNDLGFTDTVNLANGETQTEVQFRVGSLPLVQHVQDILTSFLQDDLGLPVRFRFDVGAEKDDRLMSAQIAEIMIRNGVISPSEVREDLYGLQEPNGVVIPRFLFANSAGPIPIANLFGIAGAVDNEAGMPVVGAPLPDSFTPAVGVVPEAAPVMKEETAGITTTTGAVGSPLLEDEEDEELEELTKAEIATFKRFVKARKRDGKWRDFKFEVVGRRVAEDLNFDGRVEMERELFGTPDDASFLAKGWRESADVVPQHKYDIKLTDYYTPIFSAALLALLNSMNFETVISQMGNRIVKDAETDALFAQVMARLGDSGSNADIAAALQSVLAESYVAGAHAATQQTGGTYLSTAVGNYASETDWDNWVPGNMAGASALVDGGMSKLLNQAGITLDGITDTVRNVVGNKIAQGVQSGLSNGSIARLIRDDIGSKWRAEMIAHTETTRGVMSATLDTYGEFGIEYYNIVLSASACAGCRDRKAAGPYKSTDLTGMPPIHPFCRCATLPEFDSQPQLEGQQPKATESVMPPISDNHMVEDALAAFEPSMYDELPTLGEDNTDLNAAVSYYRGSGYRAMNSYLRTGLDRNGSPVPELTIAHADNLKNALNSHPLTKDTIFYRTQNSGRSILTEEMRRDPSLAVGHEFAWESFTSTTTSEPYRGLADPTTFSNPTMSNLQLVIHAPKGTFGATIGNEREWEYLLAPGTKAKVVSIIKDADGYMTGINVILFPATP